MIDLKKLQFVMAVDISYFDEQIQNWICEYIKDNGFIKPVQISALKNYPNLSKANQFSVISIMNDALCQTAHCGRGKSHFIFGGLASPIVPYRNLTQTTDGITADCRSLV